MNIYNFLFAQDNANLKKWQEIECTGIDQINCSEMWGLDSGSNQYILSSKSNKYFYQFIANKNEATLEQKIDLSLLQSTMTMSPQARAYFENETFLYDVWLSQRTISKYNLEQKKGIDYLGTKSNLGNQCFPMNNNSYRIHYGEQKLYRLEFNTKDGTINHCELCNLDYIPIDIFSVGVLKDTVYYLSDAGLCSIKVSDDDTTVCELVESVNNIPGIDDSIIFATDKQNKIWIMNTAMGVIEYDSTTKKASKIAELPDNKTRMDYSKLCFYSENYLYYIANQKVFSLDLTPQEDPDAPDDPDNPTRPHDQSGHTCGLLGLEFFVVLLGISILRFCWRK